MKFSLLTSLSRNWVPKIGSLMFAIALFSVHRYQNYSVRTYIVPIEMQLIDNMSVVSQDYLSTNITISGPKNEMQNISKDDLRILADLSSFVEKGDYQVPIQIFKKDSMLKYSHITTEIKPDLLNVKIDEKTSKSVFIRPSFIGLLPDGYSIDSVVLDPSEIIIKGAKTRLDHLLSIATKDISLNGQTSNFSIDIECKDLLQVDFPTKTMISVDVKLKTKEIEKEFRGIDVKYKNLSDNFKSDLLTRKINLIIKADAKEFVNFNKNILSVEVDLSDITVSGFYNVPFKVIGLPSFMTIKDPTGLDINISEKN